MQVPIFKNITERDYQHTYQLMTDFTDNRTHNSQDEIWFVQHKPIFTLGRNGNKNNLLKTSDIPVVKTNRGGDITYHGPGQLVVYCLIDLNRLGLGVKSLVSGLEQVVINYLKRYGVVGHRIEKAPGVYVDNTKLASLGLRVRKGCSFHGLAINIDMDLMPFSYINPCGLTNMKVVQLKDLGIQANIDEVACVIKELMLEQFYNETHN